MTLRKVLKKWDIRAGSVGALHLVMLAAVVCTARANPPANIPNAGQTPATKPAANMGAQVQTEDVNALKQLIEQKVAEQSPNAAQTQPNAAQPSAKQASSRPRMLNKPQPIVLNKGAAMMATDAPPGPEGERPSLGLTPPPADQPQPRWSCAKDSIEKPAIWNGKAATYTFTAKNEGEGPLNIEIKGCCGSKISGSKSRTIQPGQTEDIEVTIATSGREGEFTRKIRVQTNDVNNPQVELTCKGRVLAAFKADPKVVNFGTIPRDAGPVTKTVTLTRGDGGPLHPKVAACEGHAAAELREIEPGEKYTLDITVSPPWPNDKVRGSVMIETGLEEAPQDSVRYFGAVEARLRAEPRALSLPAGEERPTELRTRLVWAGAPGRALAAVASDPALQAKIVEEDGQQFVVLSVPAGYELPAKKPASVSVTTDDPVADSLRIPISAGAAAREPARPATLMPTGAANKATQSAPATQR